MRNMIASWLVCGLVFLVWPSLLWAEAIRGRWIGQDGHDFVGPSSAVAPSGVQDVRFRIEGLPADETIVSASIRGLGGDEWLYQGRYGPWKAHLVRGDGASSADFFVEPSKAETGRPFTISLKLSSGRSVELKVAGGRADPNLRMPWARLSARWVGQTGKDRTGEGPNVGPDGRVDAEVGLGRLMKGVSVESAEIRASSGSRWAFGTNPKGVSNAEFEGEGDDPSGGRLLFQPLRDLKGQTLQISLTYSNHTTDSVELAAGPTDPARRVPPARPPGLDPVAIEGRWLGQDGGPHRGWVRVQISGLPDQAVTAASVSDPAGVSWIYRGASAGTFEVGSYPKPLEVSRDGADVVLAFPPARDEAGSTLSARFRFEDGREFFADLEGGPCSPEKRAPVAAPTSCEAQPGDDLQALVDRFGTVTLSPGTYRLDRPLVLSKPCRLTGPEEGATLEFHQPADAGPWRAAIKIHAGQTVLEGFSVRIPQPVRWAEGISYGPAVVGTSDNFDRDIKTSRIGIHLRRLDLESPPPSRKWEESVRLARLVTAECGSVEQCRLRGGIVEFSGGPWTITDNVFEGVPPGAVSPCVFAGHDTHDLILARNRSTASGPSGKTWRFVVLTNRGAFDRVEDNVVEEIGPRDDDVIPSMNAPEIILTESYHLRFEGRPLGLFQDGRVLVIPDPQGEPAEPGDVVSVLEGPHAGEFVRVAQRIDRETYLLDSGLKTLDIISISPAFWSERFEGNRVDARGSSVANGFVLAGNHFGTVVKGNQVLGCGEALRLLACPSESPGPWGWSHCPFLGVTVEGNTVRDNLGFSIAVEHGPAVKSGGGRVYQGVSLKNNVVFYSREPDPDVHGFTIGDPGGRDASELVVGASGNAYDGSFPASVLVHAARINGREVKGRVLRLPGVPEGR